ncbi:uroporphyrinogen decarboxylase|uniref:Uroporphyrinogen decarboxylase n=1 Tax=Dendrosporobacter quercicolus TaxID=146817 RepID=A0A1G9RZK6_9FIRM|nr:uroporphyrinogen decarboxylase family protein [Dendrosporobacter quercicolus]NSL49513.1 uroporphyrinogen decarboxylase [Dendrosporobacter quercicolus DSM 1736]SDM28689.1 uroporphyrinogen decarboxylase [Dendrosporobacter quercicolus]
MRIFRDEMTPKERITAVLAGKPYDRVPCSIYITGQAGKAAGISPWDCYYSAAKIAQIQIEAHRIFGVEAVTSGPGLPGIAEAIGSTVYYPGQENTPYITDFAVKAYADIHRLEIPDPGKKGRLPIHLEALEILVERFHDTVPVNSNIAGPFTTAANVRGTESFLRDIYRNPEFVHQLLRLSLNSTLSYVKAAAGIGANITIADPTASSTLISPSQFREFALPYLQELATGIAELTGSAPSLHICGNTTKIWPDMARSGAGILSLDDTVDLEAAKLTVGNQVALLGNVKPTATMYLGTPADVTAEVKECLRKAHDNPKGYILALGCGLPLGAPADNIHALFAAAREFGKYPIDSERLN